MVTGGKIIWYLLDVLSRSDHFKNFSVVAKVLVNPQNLGF